MNTHACTLLVGLLSVLAGSANAQPYVLDELPTPSGGSSFGIAADPDGSVWYASSNPSVIGHVSPTGHIAEYPIPTTAPNLTGIVVGPDDNLWFGEWSPNRIGRISKSGKNFQEFTVPESPHGPLYFANPRSLIVGPDGNIWFTAGSDALGRITTAGEVTMFYLPVIGCVPDLPFYSEPYDLIVGPDDALWLSVTLGTGPVRFDLATHEFQVMSVWQCGTTSTNITSGPDGNFWLTDFYLGHLFRVTPSGALTTFDVPGNPVGIVSVGNDLFVARRSFEFNMISRVDSATGIVVEDFRISPPNGGPQRLAVDTAGNIWSSQVVGIGRLSRHPLTCIDALALTYQNQTLTMRFAVKTEMPALWSTVLFANQSVIPLWFAQVPAVSPGVIVDVPLSGFPSVGPVAVLTTLINSSLQVCGDVRIIDTGPPN